MTPSKWLSSVCIFALFVLQFGWHALWSPPQSVDPWLFAGFFALPILPAVVLLLLRHRAAAFWGGVAALLYFSHGVMAAWSTPSDLWPGLLQAVLACVQVIAASIDGLRARFAGKRPAPPAV